MHTRAWRILTAAALVGMSGDLLLRGGMWRFGFALWMFGLVTSVFVLAGRPETERALMLGGVALAAMGVAWRDSPMLYAIDMLSVVCMGALTIWHGTGRSLSDLTLVESARVGILAVFNTIGGAARVFEDEIGEPEARAQHKGSARALTIGAVLAAPPLLIVTALLAASDKVFEGVMSQILRTVFADGVSHLFVALLLAWLAAGWLRAGVGSAMGASLPELRTPGLSFLSVAVGLYSLLALLVLFVVTQARVLFGGAAFLRETEGLSVATYARDGFFQLILAAGVVIGTLVLAEWLMSDDDARERHHYRLVAGALLGLVTMLLVSSAVRIWLYVTEFGLTVDRSLASAAILWVLATIATFAATTLRGRAAFFAPVTVLNTVAWVTLLNLANPEAIVVRVNVARAEAGQPFDAMYHSRLSADALPALRESAARISPSECSTLFAGMHWNWRQRGSDEGAGFGDWRSRDLPQVQMAEWMASGAPLCPAGAVR